MNNSVLYVAATPIGNLEDVTIRTLNTLSQCQVIICENSHTSYKLFDLLKINRSDKQFIQYGDFNNKDHVIVNIVDKIKQFSNTVLITEAGTPLISDPGYKLVKHIRKFHKDDITISPIPGASAITAFLSVSGIPTDKFMFYGFLPKTSGRRDTIIKNLEKINHIQKTTFVFYESKYKLLNLIKTLNEYYPEATLSVGKDLTKLHEHIFYGNIQTVLKELTTKQSLKGEYVIHVDLN